MFTLQIITISTREERKGGLVASWFLRQAHHHGKFNIEPLDLADVRLPMYDEPRHPRLQQYAHEHTKRWSETISRADAFVFVTPEYNHHAPPSLINALDYLNREWAYKPVGFVSYGGVSGGTRSVETLLNVVTTLKMMPMAEAVNIPFFTQYIDATSNEFDPGEVQAKAGVAMLDELLRWTEAMQSLRA